MDDLDAPARDHPGAPDLLLAVDGGGTKTRVLVADLQGEVLGEGAGPGSNHHRVGFEEFARAVTVAMEAALRQVPGGPSPNGSAARSGRIAAGCFGLAGVDTPEDEALITAWVRDQAVAEHFTVLNDSELILAAGTPEGWGVALIGGTGSVCLGRTPGGRSVRVGGWGPLLGDEGSGYHIGLRALQTATQTADGRASARALLDAVLRHWSTDRPEGLIPLVHGPEMDQSRIAGLAAVVLDLAEAGDAAALAIRAESVSHLARLLETMVHKLGSGRPPLALGGGLLRDSMRRELVARVGGLFGDVTHVLDPCRGALVLARRLVGHGHAGAAAVPAGTDSWPGATRRGGASHGPSGG